MDSRNSPKQTLRPTGRCKQSAMLSRQTSFDEEGCEGKLSSSQVKQRLKTHVLNRRRRSAASEQAVDAPKSWRMNTFDGTFGHADNRFLATARWYSADCAESPNFKSLGRTEELANDFSMPIVQSGDAQTNLASEHAMLDPPKVAALRNVCPPSESPSIFPGGDIRKTISAPNLFENPWPLRIISQLLLNHPALFLSPNPGSALSSRMASLLSQRLDSSTEQVPSSKLFDVPVGKPVDQPCAVPGGLPGDLRTNPLLQHPALRVASRPPLESSASEDSAVERTTLELKMRSYMTELMTGDLQGISSGLSLKPHISQLTSSSFSASLASPANLHSDTAMDWEPGEDQAPSEIPDESATTNPVAATTGHPDCASLSEFWAKLPVEDWLVTSSRSSETESGLLTGLAFDPAMLHHSCICPTALDSSVHPECATRMVGILERLFKARFQIPPSLSPDSIQLLHNLKVSHNNPLIQQALDKLVELGAESVRAFLGRIPLLAFCQLFRARMANEDELCLFHTREHVRTFGTIPGSSVLTHSSSPDSASSSPVSADLPPLCKLKCGGLGVDSDTVWNPNSTSRAARLAVGQVICLAHKVANDELRNGFALIRPPGHHAEPNHAMGFCYFNSVAVAASYLLHNRILSRVLILDYDIHHGNGMKFAVKRHPGLVYVSIHRYDKGTFFPGTGPVFDYSCTSSETVIPSNCKHMVNIAWETPLLKRDDSRPTGPLDAGYRRELWRQYYLRKKPHLYESTSPTVFHQHDFSSTGSSRSGTNNLDSEFSSCSCCHSKTSNLAGSSGSSTLCSMCWSQSLRSSTDSGISPYAPVSDPVSANRSLRGFGDAEYLAALRCIVLPIAYEFQPELILISAGFDPAPGHDEALGGYSVSPGTFAWITRQCLSISNGKVVMALEGGYNPSVVGDCVTACVNSLLLPNPREQWVPHSPSRNLDSYLDAYQSARDWIPLSELNRPPCPEAVSTLAQVAQQQAKSGWKCMQNVNIDNLGRSFTEFLEFEHQLAMQASSLGTTEQPLLTQHLSAGNSPLTTGIAQLRMDQS